MPRYAYERLTALDNSFLLLEKPNAYMHVASTLILDAKPLQRPEGGIDIEAIKAATAAALHRIPRYRQKLKYIPLESHPVWIDDDRFNLDYHVRHTALPRPGSIAQLKALSGRIMQQHLDRARPLWEMWIVEGLEDDRFAMISKVHHCMIDGVSGVDLLNTQLRPTPDRHLPEPVPYFPRPAPSSLELLRHEVLRRAALPFAAFRDARDFLREAQDSRVELLVRARAVAETLGATFRRPSDTPLNRPIGPHRRFDWLTTSIEEIKEVRRALGGSLNDIVLTVVTGAVRRFLMRRGVDVSTLDFRILAPVSVRSENERGQLGNRVSAWLIDLPVGLPDARQQLARIAARTQELKESRQAVGAAVLTQAADWTPSTLLALGARNATRLLPFNMVVTNVPGPQVPIYLLGARLLESYPHVPLADRLGLGIALLSYDGRMHWGFNADYDVVPDLADFVQDITASFRKLREIAGPIALRAAEASRAAVPRPVVAKKKRGRATSPTASAG
jgi:diacylglycerol O-acyltransferase / wax synthase